MSAAPLRSSARPLGPAAPRQDAPPQRRAHLRAVPAPRHARSIAPFALLCVAIVVGALAAVLVLNTTMAEGAYDQRDLKIDIANLHQERAAALTQLEANAAPGALAQQAQSLGMVPATSIGFVSLAGDQVLQAGGRP